MPRQCRPFIYRPGCRQADEGRASGAEFVICLKQNGFQRWLHGKDGANAVKGALTPPFPNTRPPAYRLDQLLSSKSSMLGMSISATNVRFDEHTMWVELSDGRTIGVPLAWFPRLLNATLEALRRVEISPRGLHWESLDEDISIAGLLAGRGDRTVKRKG